MIVEAVGAKVSLERFGEGPDLLLLHSLLTNRHAFDPLLPALTSRWRVNKVDLPGFGESTLVAPTVDAYANAISLLLESGGYDPATTNIIGNGLGSFVGLGTAVHHGNQFNKMVLIGCGAKFPDEAKEGFRTMIERVERSGMAGVVDIAVQRIFTEEYITAHPMMEEQRRLVLLRTNPAAFLAACRALLTVDYTPNLPSVINPTLVIVGTEDRATPPAMGRSLAAGIRGAQLELLEGLAHAPQLQAPERLLDTLWTFLDQ